MIKPAVLAGASVFRGVESFGASTVIRFSRLLSGKQGLPPAGVVVDEKERVRRFLPTVKDLVTEGWRSPKRSRWSAASQARGRRPNRRRHGSGVSRSGGTRTVRAGAYPKTALATAKPMNTAPSPAMTEAATLTNARNLAPAAARLSVS